MFVQSSDLPTCKKEVKQKGTVEKRQRKEVYVFLWGPWVRVCDIFVPLP
jgi:hypothetical protein